MSGQSHHVIAKQRIAQRVSEVAVKLKLYGPGSLTEAEARLLETPLQTVLDDRRNQVRLKVNLHHRAHHGANPYRLKPNQLPSRIDEFASDYALEGALERQLTLIREAAES